MILGRIIYSLVCILMMFLSPQQYAWSEEAKVGDNRLLVTKRSQALKPPQPQILSLSEQLQFCPEPGQLTKEDNQWISKDNRWKSYTPSSANKISSFLGAQWIGIKVGKIICLYQTDEAVSFPLALEQAQVQAALDPKTPGWSALVSNHKLCKSASVADCAYYLEQKKPVDIYQEIKYAPQVGQDQPLGL